MSDKTDTPETDNAAHSSDEPGSFLNLWELCEKLERERDELREAIRIVDAKLQSLDWGYTGDNGTGCIFSALTDLLPESKIL